MDPKAEINIGKDDFRKIYFIPTVLTVNTGDDTILKVEISHSSLGACDPHY